MRIFAYILLYAFLVLLNSFLLAEASSQSPNKESTSQRTYYRRDSTGRLVKCDEDTDVTNTPNERIRQDSTGRLVRTIEDTHHLTDPPNADILHLRPLAQSPPRRGGTLYQHVKINHGAFVLRGGNPVGIVQHGLLVDYPIQDRRRAALFVPQPGDIYESETIRLIFENRENGWKPIN